MRVCTRDILPPCERGSILRKIEMGSLSRWDGGLFDHLLRGGEVYLIWKNRYGLIMEMRWGFVSTQDTWRPWERRRGQEGERGFILRKIDMGSLCRWDGGLLCTRDTWPPCERGRGGSILRKIDMGLLCRWDWRCYVQDKLDHLVMGCYFEKDRYQLIM